MCGFLAYFVFWLRAGLEKTGWLGGALAIPFLLFAPYLAPLVLRQKPSSTGQTEEALDTLSQSALSAPKEWLQQLGLYGSVLAAVPWHPPAGNDLVDPVVRDRSAGLRGSSRDVDHLVDDFLALKPPRLVITGEPGSGKTSLAVAIAQKVAERRRDQGGGAVPLPVLFPLAEWSPRAWQGWRWKLVRYRGGGSLERWMVATLHRRCPALRSVAQFGNNAAEQLIRSGRILPVFDGLDEIPSPDRVAALSALNRADSKSCDHQSVQVVAV
ncbi:NACHT domain-containing protein [Streptomyces sp. NPDC059862]|uniref:NACHT domain-containing protein n=1 Tax=Streptomyces sp. NPDC059862 TaxID=3346975 RepID=UPI003651E24F